MQGGLLAQNYIFISISRRGGWGVFEVFFSIDIQGILPCSYTRSGETVRDKEGEQERQRDREREREREIRERVELSESCNYKQHKAEQTRQH